MVVCVYLRECVYVCVVCACMYTCVLITVSVYTVVSLIEPCRTSLSDHPVSPSHQDVLLSFLETDHFRGSFSSWVMENFVRSFIQFMACGQQGHS